MANLKVKHHRIERVFKKKTNLRQWLNEQPRKNLSYTIIIENADGIGWTAQEFMRECWARGLDVRIGTAWKWLQGTMPGPLALHALRKIFTGIKF